MGILINGMEMPKEKAVAVVIHPDGTAYTAEMVAGVCTEYLADCTAVTVPPHGRLIDADELNVYDISPVYGFSVMGVTEEDIIQASTIIPAEEVYGQYTDTAGNYHWCGTHSGEHKIKASE